jgi:hypothetical protein
MVLRARLLEGVGDDGRRYAALLRQAGVEVDVAARRARTDRRRDDVWSRDR